MAVTQTPEMKALTLALGLGLLAALLPPASSEQSVDVRLRGGGGRGAQEAAGTLIVGSGTAPAPRARPGGAEGPVPGAPGARLAPVPAGPRRPGASIRGGRGVRRWHLRGGLAWEMLRPWGSGRG